MHILWRKFYNSFELKVDKQFTTDIKLKGEFLEIVDEVKLLGVVINNNLKWDKNTSFLVKQDKVFWAPTV